MRQTILLLADAGGRIARAEPEPRRGLYAGEQGWGQRLHVEQKPGRVKFLSAVSGPDTDTLRSRKDPAVKHLQVCGLSPDWEQPRAPISKLNLGRAQHVTA